MRSPASGLKFCSARTRVACAILAHAASRVTFHGYFESTSTKQYTVQTFSGAKDVSLGRFLFMVFTSCCKYSKSNVLNR